jgi:hypothetical protein
MKSRRMRWEGYVARKGESDVYIVFWWGNLRERKKLKDQHLEGRMILKWIFKNQDVRHELD